MNYSNLVHFAAAVYSQIQTLAMRMDEIGEQSRLVASVPMQIAHARDVEQPLERGGGGGGGGGGAINARRTKKARD